MFFREKVSGPRSYLQIVEGYREGGKVKQRVVATLGRLDRLRESGQLEDLIASGARFSDKISVIGAHMRGEVAVRSSLAIGPGTVFHRLWVETGIQECLAGLLACREFKFDVERAIFLTVLHRLFQSGSDRAAEKWQGDYLIPGEGPRLDLHHLYRAMAWLGQELPENAQEGRTPLAPRCTKDLVEERLFARRKDLFTDLVLAFFDTTTLYFEGQGGETIGQRGHNKDGRPDLKQMVVGLVMDSEGRPIFCELWPGNTTDVKTLIPVVDRLCGKFQVRQVVIVADRGMISKDTIHALEARQLGYILGARMRSQKEVNEEVLSRAGRYKEVYPERKHSKDPSPLMVKDVWVENRRYVVCFNEEQARKDAADREQILEKLQKKLEAGPKSLVGNKGFRKYLKNKESGFKIDEEKIETEKRLDGKWVLRTNTDLPTAEVALTYKQLWMVEDLFRSVKSILETRPIYHKRDVTIRGHVFASFLALVLMRELQDRMDRRGWQEAEWADVLRDLNQMTETEFEAADGKRYVIRSQVKGWAGKAFQAAGVAIPATLRQVGNGTTTSE